MKLGFIVSCVIVVISAFLVLRPVPIVNESEAIIVNGVVMRIYEGGEKDVVFQLMSDPTRYYINRGMEMGLTIDGLRDSLINNRVIIKYPEYWTPLDWNNSIRHISYLEYGNDILFNEFLDAK